MRAERSLVMPARGSLVVAAVWTALLIGCGRNPGKPVRVTVPQGATLASAADSLARAGVISSPRLFRLYAKVKRDDRDIKAGTYMLPRGSSWATTLDALRGGKGLIRVVTIPEGFALTQIAAVLSSKLGVTADSIDAAVRDTALRRRLDVPTPTVEGYLFPDTYIFPDRTTARAAVTAMVKRFEQVWEPAWTARLDSVPLSRHDIVTLASLVEKEARRSEERPVIAAVYLNRLRDRMLLQADPTVQYALGQHQSRVLYKHLEVDSPYNTYKHAGLPPGPIASPGRASLVAALYPANVPYKFFVALPDGHHEFRVDFAAHEQARRAARRAWDSLATQTPQVAPKSGGSRRDSGSASAPNASRKSKAR